MTTPALAELAALRGLVAAYGRLLARLVETGKTVHDEPFTAFTADVVRAHLAYEAAFCAPTCCPACEETKPRTAFRYTHRGLSQRCEDCIAAGITTAAQEAARSRTGRIQGPRLGAWMRAHAAERRMVQW